MTKFNFISIFDNALSEEECQLIIDEFEKNPDKLPGCCDDGVHENIKKSTDITYDITEDTDTTLIIGARLEEHMKKYIEEYPDVDFMLHSWSCVRGFNIQKYQPNEGFFTNHCENLCKDSSYRVLVWMFYLNTVPDGGTIFPTLDIKIEAITGRLVIWPAYWTHVHRGEISKSHIKYIATGWHSFD
tara:strand:+ start:86 stop:643 length:558 start_codon:yes stop_codon:yes gene_type:complete